MATSNIWHRVLLRQFVEGETIPLDHLSEDDINKLIAKGLIVKLIEKKVLKVLKQDGIQKRKPAAVPVKQFSEAISLDVD